MSIPLEELPNASTGTITDEGYVLGFTKEIDDSEDYDETVFAYVPKCGEKIQICTMNTRSVEEGDENRWEVSLTPDEAIAFAIHLVELVNQVRSTSPP